MDRYSQLKEKEMKVKYCRFALNGVLSGLLTLGMSGVAAVAQDSMQQGSMQQGNAMGQGQGGGHRGAWGDPDEQLAHMTRRYKLTADQQAQIKPILTAQHDQMEQLHSNTSMSREDKMAKMKSVREDTKSKIEAVLTADQKQKFEADQSRMQERKMEHGGGSMGSQQAPPQ